MPDTTFDINSLDAARRLQSLLNDYYVRSKLVSSPAVPAELFATIYTLVRTRRADSRLLWAVIDFELTYLSMMRDIHGAADVWVGRFSPGSPKPDSVLDDFHAFAGKLDILHCMTSFALRCRAFWDKSMGILFLLYDDSNYQAFAGAASRKRFFQRHAISWPSISPYLLRSLDKVNVTDWRPSRDSLTSPSRHRPARALLPIRPFTSTSGRSSMCLTRCEPPKLMVPVLYASGPSPCSRFTNPKTHGLSITGTSPQASLMRCVVL